MKLSELRQLTRDELLGLRAELNQEEIGRAHV